MEEAIKEEVEEYGFRWTAPVCGGCVLITATVKTATGHSHGSNGQTYHDGEDMLTGPLTLILCAGVNEEEYDDDDDDNEIKLVPTVLDPEYYRYDDIEGNRIMNLRKELENDDDGDDNDDEDVDDMLEEIMEGGSSEKESEEEESREMEETRRLNVEDLTVEADVDNDDDNDDSTREVGSQEDLAKTDFTVESTDDDEDDEDDNGFGSRETVVKNPFFQELHRRMRDRRYRGRGEMHREFRDQIDKWRRGEESERRRKILEAHHHHRKRGHRGHRGGHQQILTTRGMSDKERKQGM